MVKAVIIAAGNGTRLWPLSRKMLPKQFIKIIGQNLSPFQQTILRSLKLGNGEKDVHLIVHERHMPIIRAQLAKIGVDIPKKNFTILPYLRGTLDALLLAVWKMKGDPTVVMLAADHYIKEENVLINTLKYAADHVDEHIVAIGVKPTEPYTGYGYIKPGRKLADRLYKVDEFKEKPPKPVADEYVKKGYLWNTFMHVFKKSVLLGETARILPELYRTFEKYDGDIKKIFPILEPHDLSKDLLENTDKNAVVPVRLTWSDIGAFDLVHKLMDKDEQGNAYNAPTITIDAKDNYARTYGNKIVALVGVEDLFIVDTPDALLVGHKSHAQKVRDIVKYLDAKEDARATHHAGVQTTWGEVSLIDWSEDYKVSRILIFPGKGGSISITSPTATMTVVRGSVKVDKKILSSGDSIALKRGQRKKIENVGNTEAVILVVGTLQKGANPYIEILKELEG